MQTSDLWSISAVAMAGYEAAATFDPYMVDGEEDEKSASVKEEPEDEWTWDSNEWWSWEGWE